MIQRIRCGVRLFGNDIRALLPAILALAWYWLVTHLLFDRFCPMQILLGLPCPGCGMTRAFMLVLTGRFAAAWSLQPPGVRMDRGGRLLWNTAVSGGQRGDRVCRSCRNGKWKRFLGCGKATEQARENVDMGSACPAGLGRRTVSVAGAAWFPGECGRSGAHPV